MLLQHEMILRVGEKIKTTSIKECHINGTTTN